MLKCSGGQFDVQLSPDARYVVMAHESASANKACHPSEEGAQVIDVSNKNAPREVAFISDKTDGSSGQVVDGAHNVTLDWPNLYIDNYTQTYPVTDVFSLSTPSRPRRVGQIDFISNPSNGGSGPHDSIPDHRPDGKDLLYAASIQKSDIIDIGNPSKPRVLQTILDPEVGISHGAEPNFNRKTLIVTDEYGGGSGVGACGGSPDDPALPLPGPLARLEGRRRGALLLARRQRHRARRRGRQAGHLQHHRPAQRAGSGAGRGRLHEPRVLAGARPEPVRDRLVRPRHPDRGLLRSRQPEADRLVRAHQRRHLVGQAPPRLHLHRATSSAAWTSCVYKGEGGKAWPTTSGPADIQRALVQGCPTKGAAGRCPNAL